MKRLAIILFGLIAVLPATAQVTVINSKPFRGDSVWDAGRKPQVTFDHPKKWNYGIQLGTSASFSKGYGSGISTYVSPHITWQATSRFRVNAGISLVNTTLFGYKPYYYGFESGQGFSGNYTHALVYVEGQYLLSKNLQLNGSLYADVPLTGQDPANPYSTRSLKGFSMDLRYRLGEHAFIQAGFNYMDSRGPYYYDPFRPSGTFYTNPFGNQDNDPFNW